MDQIMHSATLKLLSLNCSRNNSAKLCMCTCIFYLPRIMQYIIYVLIIQLGAKTQ